MTRHILKVLSQAFDALGRTARTSSISFSHPPALRAAPIVLEATTLTSDGCGSTVSGDNFSLTGMFAMPSCVGRDAPVGIGGQDLIGNLSVREIPGRYAIAYGACQPSLFKDVTPQYVPIFFTGPIDVNVVLSGSLQVCLAQAGVSLPNGALYFGCDPQFANFGGININVAGLARYYAYNGAIQGRNFGGFSGTSAAAPEPAHLGMVASAILVLPLFVSQQKRRKIRV